MLPGKKPKTQLSAELEGLFFDRVLKRREVEALRERCESYQAGSPDAWKAEILPAYSRYFGYLSALKTKTVFEELDSYGYMDPIFHSQHQLIDFGAGTLGATLGALDFFKEKDPQKRPSRILAIDRDLKPLQWAENHFQTFLQPGLEVRNRFPNEAKIEKSLLIEVDVLNEMQLLDGENSDAERLLTDWVEKLDEHSLLVLIEPANKKINRAFLSLRDRLLGQRTEVHALLPCTHQLACPALANRSDWCHEERSYRAPSQYWNLVHELGFERSSLQFSMLCLSRKNSVFGSQHSRMVSRPLKSKGKCEKWFCGAGERWKVTGLKRYEKQAEFQEFFEAERGDILQLDRSSSTLRKRPD